MGEGIAANPDTTGPPSIERGEYGIQLLAFDVRDRPGNDVPGDAAHDVGFLRGKAAQFFIQQRFYDRDEGVPVIKAKGRQPVTLVTKLQQFGQG